MAKIPAYEKDEETGAVIFKDATALPQEEKLLKQTN